ncbi:hypothetical protein, partial [Duncaniella muris]|uniref:hypothetical protein n=1 Tax=Duncaniella muris TaxID=2094150 RepID=UPI002714590D
GVFLDKRAGGDSLPACFLMTGLVFPGSAADLPLRMACLLCCILQGCMAIFRLNSSDRRRKLLNFVLKKHEVNMISVSE